MRAGWHGDYPCITIHPHAFFLLDFDRSTEDAPRKGHDIECCCASSKQASSGNVRAAQELLADMNEIAGIQACLDSELDVMAEAFRRAKQAIKKASKQAASKEAERGRDRETERKRDRQTDKKERLRFG